MFVRLSILKTVMGAAIQYLFLKSLVKFFYINELPIYKRVYHLCPLSVIRKKKLKDIFSLFFHFRTLPFFAHVFLVCFQTAFKLLTFLFLFFSLKKVFLSKICNVYFSIIRKYFLSILNILN